MGPSALRIAGIVEAIERLGNTVRDRDVPGVTSRVDLEPDSTTAKYLGPIVDVCERLALTARRSLDDGAVPVFLGGDHSLAIGTIAGVAGWHRDRDEKVGVIWFDAHADMNTPETSPSGNIHGMPLSALLGYGPDELVEIGGFRGKVDAKNTVVIGARDVDQNERDVVARSGITVFSMTEIDELGIAEVTRQAIEKANDGTAGIHLSFDIDGLDPEVAPGVGTPVRGGVNFREAHLFLELIAETEKMIAMDIVELNPVRDLGNVTADAVVHLVQSAFGRRII